MIVGIIQARISSRRLPGKVLLNLGELPMLVQIHRRVSNAKLCEKVLVATSDLPEDLQIVEACKQYGIPYFCGSHENVLKRFHDAAITARATHVVRFTADCPLLDPTIIDEVIDFHLQKKNDITTNARDSNFPDGLDVEVITVEALKIAAVEAATIEETEHVTPFLLNRPDRFQVGIYKGVKDHASERWTVDTPEDFEFVSTIFDHFKNSTTPFGMHEILAFLNSHPELRELNSSSERNEGMARSREQDALLSRYSQSQELLDQALKIIPLGSQTFSKSITQYPRGISPHFLKRAAGSRVWDVDGNEYLDFVNALLSVNLGHGDPDVLEAVTAQLKDGVSFSLAHPLEMKLAKLIIEMVPSAEMVRFGKNGSDATSAAIRIARAHTNRDHIAVCGYHGWQDWYIGSTTRNLGVPATTCSLTHSFQYNNLSSLTKILKEHEGQVAAVIMEPMNVCFPENNFLTSVQQLTKEAGALFVLDETITGFRFSQGGAQELFNITPDLTTLGKGIANGFPLSVITGKEEFMKLTEEIFFSTTFGGETVSLAAALATLEKIKTQPVLSHIQEIGERIIQETNSLLKTFNLHDVISLTGHPSWSLFSFADYESFSLWEIKTLFLQEAYRRGVLTIGSHNISFAHSHGDVDFLLGVYRDIFQIIQRAIFDKKMNSLLLTDPLAPLFTVR